MTYVLRSCTKKWSLKCSFLATAKKIIKNVTVVIIMCCFINVNREFKKYNFTTWFYWIWLGTEVIKNTKKVSPELTSLSDTNNKQYNVYM